MSNAAYAPPPTQNIGPPALAGGGMGGGGQLPLPAPLRKFHDVTIVTRRKYGCAKVAPVPPEEFGIQRVARSIADCGYCFHEVLRIAGDMVAEGWDARQIASLPTRTITNQTEQLARDTVDEETGITQTDEDDASRPVAITEHYVRMAYEGDGKPRLYRVTTGGGEGQILRRNGEDQIIQIDMIPFASMTPVIVTHRFFGKSIADLVMDIQRIKTALVRGLLDNTYLAVNPRPVISEQHANENTLDDLLVSRPGAPVRVRQPGGLEWTEMPGIADKLLPVLQYVDSEREWRTGVTRIGQGVDPTVLQNQTATVAAQQYSAAAAKTKLIARIFAETGIKDMFVLLHGVIRKHQKKPGVMPKGTQWIEVDPRDWKKREAMTVNVGLGGGGQQQELANAQTIGMWQQQMLAGGMIDVVQKKNVYNAAKLGLRAMKIRDPDTYFTDPDSPQAQQIAQQQAQAAQQKPDPKLQVELIKQQGDQQKMQIQAQLDQQKMAIDTQHQAAKNTAEAALAEKKFQLERELKIIDANLKIVQAEREHAYKLAEMGMQAHQSEQANAQHQSDTGAKQQESSVTHAGIRVLADQVGKLHEQHAALLHTIAAPKRRIAERDKSGKLVSVREETLGAA
jgi:hypothetical protein